MVIVFQVNSFVGVPTHFLHTLVIESPEVFEFLGEVGSIADNDGGVAEFGSEDEVALSVYGQLVEDAVVNGVVMDEAGEAPEAGYWLLAVGYWLLAVGCWLLAVGDHDVAEMVGAEGHDSALLGDIELVVLIEDTDKRDALGDFDLKFAARRHTHIGIGHVWMVHQHLTYSLLVHTFDIRFQQSGKRREDEAVDIRGCQQTDVVGSNRGFDTAHSGIATYCMERHDNCND